MHQEAKCVEFSNLPSKTTHLTAKVRFQPGIRLNCTYFSDFHEICIAEMFWNCADVLATCGGRRPRNVNCEFSNLFQKDLPYIKSLKITWQMSSVCQKCSASPRSPKFFFSRKRWAEIHCLQVTTTPRACHVHHTFTTHNTILTQAHPEFLHDLFRRYHVPAILNFC